MSNFIDTGLNKMLKSSLSLNDMEVEQLMSKLSKIEKFRLLTGLRFIKKEKSALSEIFFLESLIAVKKNGKCNKFIELFLNNLDEIEKLDLIDNFLFSQPYKFQVSRDEPRHVMFTDFERDSPWIKKNIDSSWRSYRDYCSSGNSPNCFCMQWLKSNQSKIDVYLKIVVWNLYKMRSAVVHECFPVVFLPNYNDNIDGIEISALMDAFPIDHSIDKFVSYRATMKPKRFYEITKNIA